jgi:glycosyltransferase involved in cell wall biosynthesis
MPRVGLKVVEGRMNNVAEPTCSKQYEAASSSDSGIRVISARTRVEHDEPITGLADSPAYDASPTFSDKLPGVLFVIENDHYPQDMRVYNECNSLIGRSRCFVIAPRGKGQRFIEKLGRVRCYRYPGMQASSPVSTLFEYFLAACCMSFCIPLIVLVHRIRVVHVANPPDFVIPMLAWLKLFRVRFVFDMHDISTETLKGKLDKDNSHLEIFLPWLERLETLSIRAADLTIATNESIALRIRQKSAMTPVVVVRNSNTIAYSSLQGIDKPCSNLLHLGYFGLLADDAAAGLENIVVLAQWLDQHCVPFRFSIVGDGPGLQKLRKLLEEAEVGHHFCFHGFVAIPDAYEIIKTFDFGIVSWGDIPKNHLHTAMKVMDYMCCGVPVCSLELEEQIRSTGGVGIHAPCFRTIARRMIKTFGNRAEYEELRRQTLERFNHDLCWELQRKRLLEGYRAILQ